jgi:hypothetical protein
MRQLPLGGEDVRVVRRGEESDRNPIHSPCMAWFTHFCRTTWSQIDMKYSSHLDNLVLNHFVPSLTKHWIAVRSRII